MNCGTCGVVRIACLIGFLLCLAVACSTPSTPTPDPDARLYTRTPTPTPVPATPTPTLSAQALYEQGRNQRIAWDLEAALERFDAALALEPDQAAIYASRADLHRLAGRYEAAAEDVEAALALDPALGEAWRQKALLAQAQADWDGALVAANELVELQPDDGATYLLRARIYAEGFGRVRSALLDLNRAVARDPAFQEATQVERWRIQAHLGRWEKALSVSEEMFAGGGEDPLHYYYRGWSLVQLGRLDEAIEWLLSGIERFPDHPVVLYYALGRAYYERLAWPETIQTMEIALAQSGAADQPGAAWRELAITVPDILGPIGVAYLELGQCETGAAILERVVQEAPEIEEWVAAAESRIEACYLALTPTPTATPWGQ